MNNDERQLRAEPEWLRSRYDSVSDAVFAVEAMGTRHRVVKAPAGRS